MRRTWTGEGSSQHYLWRRHSLKEKLARYVAYLTTALLLAWALRALDVHWPWVADAPREVADLLYRMAPPDWSQLGQVASVMLQTIHIATLGTALAVFLALPAAYIAARNTTFNGATLWLGRLIVVATRSVDTLVWALLFVAIFGPGALAGILAVAFRSIGFTGKLIAEAIEEIDPGPVEAITATGASRSKVVLFGIVPQVLATFYAVVVLRWDINIRESTVLGLVGAGGIGMILDTAILSFAWRTVSVVLIAIVTVVAFGELLSGWLRSRVL